MFCTYYALFLFKIYHYNKTKQTALDSQNLCLQRKCIDFANGYLVDLFQLVNITYKL